MNILIPMAGLGTRFQEFYDVPKPLVKVNGKTLIEHSVSTLNIDGQYIFIVLKYENYLYNLEMSNILHKLVADPIIVEIEKPTDGSAKTCLFAKEYINNNEPLIVTNIDQYFSWNPDKFLKHIKNSDPDACVSLYDHNDIILNEKSKYCFVELNKKGFATKFIEKFAISINAMNGIHYWKNGSDFISSCEQMIKDDFKFNNEYYLSGSFQYLIKEGKKINTFKMNENEYFSLGSPEEINKNKKYII